MTKKYYIVQYNDGDFSPFFDTIQRAEEDALEWTMDSDPEDKPELTIFEVRPIATTKVKIVNETKMLGNDDVLNSHLIGE